MSPHKYLISSLRTYWNTFLRQCQKKIIFCHEIWTQKIFGIFYNLGNIQKVDISKNINRISSFSCINNPASTEITAQSITWQMCIWCRNFITPSLKQWRLVASVGTFPSTYFSESIACVYPSSTVCSCRCNIFRHHLKHANLSRCLPGDPRDATGV